MLVLHAWKYITCCVIHCYLTINLVQVSGIKHSVVLEVSEASEGLESLILLYEYRHRNISILYFKLTLKTTVGRVAVCGFFCFFINNPKCMVACIRFQIRQVTARTAHGPAFQNMEV